MLNVLVMRAKISKTAEKKKFFLFFFIGEGVRLLTSLFSWGSFVAGLFFWAFLRGGCPAVFFGGVVGGVESIYCMRLIFEKGMIELEYHCLQPPIKVQV